MHFIHTSDWHLGKRIGVFSRFEEQNAVMSEICTKTEKSGAELIVISGDIFDTYNPPIEAVELYYKTVRRLSNNLKRPVVVIAGNHDSPDRIESSDPLAAQLGIIQCGFAHTEIKTPVEGDGWTIVNAFEGGFIIEYENGYSVKIIHSAFSNEQRSELKVEEQSSFHLSKLWKDATDNDFSANYTLVLSHALMSESSDDVCEEPEGEKPIEHISERLYTSMIPEGIDYVALGHLHRYQKVKGGNTSVFYSGSPLAYSFSEAHQTKYVLNIDAESTTVEPIALKEGIPLQRKRFESIESAEEWLEQNQNCWLELTLKTDSFLKPEDISRLKKCHNKIVSIIPELEEKEGASKSEKVDLSKDRKELFIDYFLSKKQQNPSDDILALFNEIVASHE